MSRDWPRRYQRLPPAEICRSDALVITGTCLCHLMQCGLLHPTSMYVASGAGSSSLLLPDEFDFPFPQPDLDRAPIQQRGFVTLAFERLTN